MNVVTMTMSVTALKIPASKTPALIPIWAKIKPTSPRGIIPTPITLFRAGDLRRLDYLRRRAGHFEGRLLEGLSQGRRMI